MSEEESIKAIDTWAEELGCDNLVREERSLFEIFTQEMSHVCCETPCSTK